MAVESLCVDADGIWRIPDGLIVGGPDDNTALHADWLDRCGFTSYEAILQVSVPFESVLDTWLGCVRERFLEARDVAAYGGLPMLGDGLSVQETVLEGATLACGPAPDAAAVLPDGSLRSDIPMMHVGTTHGSIQFSSYSYAGASSGSEQKGRINTVFYGAGDANTVKARLLSGHWKDAHDHHTGTCGETFYAYIWNAMHSGGSDKWWSSSPQTEAHHSNSWCLSDRYHLRHYGKSLTDSHSPSFGAYSIANVHWDDDWHNEPEGQKGVDHLYNDRGTFSDSSYQEWSNNQQAYIRFYHIPTAAPNSPGVETAIDLVNTAGIVLPGFELPEIPELPDPGQVT
ncbi:MAG: hypothetical protein WC876_10165 [Candidatus Thermoplasmatota archaeon]|jgi:hypothetical protein